MHAQSESKPGRNNMLVFFSLLFFSTPLPTLLFLFLFLFGRKNVKWLEPTNSSKRKPYMYLNHGLPIRRHWKVIVPEVISSDARPKFSCMTIHYWQCSHVTKRKAKQRRCGSHIYIYIYTLYYGVQPQKLL